MPIQTEITYHFRGTPADFENIGVWPAQMFLIFSLGRLEVFPHEDLGVRVAIRNLYGLEDLPDKETSYRIAIEVL